jgi:uncharacterized protein (DUF1499 family)
MASAANKELQMAEHHAHAAEPAVSPTTPWWSTAILIGGVVAAALLPLGALGTRIGLWPFSLGLLMLAAGAVLAAIGLVCGVAGIAAAHRRNLAGSKPGVYLGTAICVLVLAFMGMQFSKASSVPAIHNISTDVDDPPQFIAVSALRGAGANTLDYDTDRLAPLQQEAYPEIQPLVTRHPPEAALDRAVTVLSEMGLEVVNVDQAAGVVEATDTTFWFGFKDDVVVRVRPMDSGSIVDMRSVSRVGLSDVGVNAARIRRFMESFAGG